MSFYRIRPGGLLGCCLETIRAYDGPEIPGRTVLACKLHPDDVPSLALTRGLYWEWVWPPPASIGYAAGE